MSVFPNPAKNFVILKFKLDSETVFANIKVYDVNARFIKSINRYAKSDNNINKKL